MRFTVGKKIGGGFSIVVILLLIVFFYTFSVVNEAIKSNDKFLNVDHLVNSIDFETQLKEKEILRKASISELLNKPKVEFAGI